MNFLEASSRNPVGAASVCGILYVLAAIGVASATGWNAFAVIFGPFVALQVSLIVFLVAREMLRFIRAFFE